MRDPDGVKNGPICDSIAIIALEENDDDEETLPIVLHETQSKHSGDSIPIKSLIKFARPRGWFNQSQSTSSEYFYQILTSETGVRRIAYILSTWESTSTAARAVSIIVISRNFHAKAFKEILLQLSQDFRKPDISDASELVHFLTDELVDEGSTIEIRTKTLNVELSFDTTPTIPVTDKDVSMLFKILGFSNVVKIVHALLSDCRIVLVSSSLMRLSRSQNALLSLLYPFVYMHSCVTILPESLSEVLDSPTPFLIGVLGDIVTEFGEENIVVFLDNGNIRIPNDIEIHIADSYYYDKLQQRLRNVLFTTTSQEDLAIPNDEKIPINDFILDKKLRSCFILYFAELLYGYQYFVLYTRIKGNFEKKNPSSLSFHIGAFRGFRKLTDSLSQFILNSPYFQAFLSTRAIPRSKHDLFDEVSCMKELDQLANKHHMSTFETSKLIDQVACELIQKERFMEKCSTTRQEIFTTLYIDEKTQLVERSNSIIHTIKPKMRSNSSPHTMLPTVSKHVDYHTNQFEAHSHRDEVLRNCIDCIFDDKSHVASKSLRAVTMSMSFAPVRIELCRVLNEKATSQSLLTSRQFDDVSTLINAAIQRENEEDENGVIRSLMYLASNFNRKLSQGIHQCMYTTIQNHRVWKSVQFWTSCFYYEVHETLFSDKLKKDRKLTRSLWCHTLRPCAMEMIDLNDAEQTELVKQENEIIQAQTKHFANLMISLHIPLSESVFSVEQETFLIQQDKAKWIVWTLDSILSATGRMCNVSRTDIQTYVEAHIETMRDVYNEVAAFDNSLKKNSIDPYLISKSEFLICDPVTCYLISPNNENEVTFESLEKILPAEGCLFLSNYRVIFKGKSMNLDVTNSTVIQTLPVFSVDNFKKVTTRKIIPKELKKIKIEHVIAIRSHSSSTITVAFDDEEVNNMAIEKFLEVLESNKNGSFACSNFRKEKVNGPSTPKFGTLNAIRKLENLTKRKVEPRRLRSHSAHRGSVNFSFDKIEDLGTLKNSFHIRYAVTDYPRLGLNGRGVKLRLSSANSDYSLCATYPANFIVPSETNENELSKVAKGFVEHRLPVVTWMNKSGALLIRSSAFDTNEVVRKLKKVVQIRRTVPKLSSTFNGSEQTLNSKASSNDDNSSSIFSSGEIRSSEVQMNYFVKLAQSSPRSYEHNCNEDYLETQSWSEKYGTLTQKKHDNSRDRKTLYVLVEKGTHLKLPNDAHAEVVNVKAIKDSELKRALHRVKQIQNKDFVVDGKVSFVELWNTSNWPHQISKILELANSVTAIMSLYNSSVAICLETGKSTTTLITSLVQLMSDPYYRTLEGFQTLIEKEWLAFGHCFYKDSETRSPYIICFLDCVHQIMKQYPNSFEFSDYFLRFIAFHTTSGYFRTFLEDCEERRLQADLNDFHIPDDLTLINIWDYIMAKSKENHQFRNGRYSATSNEILVPSISLTRISMWSFFSEVFLKYGSEYDMDVVENEQMRDDEYIAPKGSPQQVIKERGSIDFSTIDFEETDPTVKNIQFNFILKLFDNSEKKSTQSTLNGADVNHDLVYYSAGPTTVQCCVCSNVITRWNRSIHCKKCKIYLHEGCSTKEAKFNGINHVYNNKFSIDESQMPKDAIVINTDPESRDTTLDTLTRDSTSPPISTVIPPLCTGYLSKRGAKLKLWVPRYFVVYPDIAKVFYFEDFDQWKSGEKPSGSIDLCDFSGFHIEPTGRRAIIELQMRNKTYRLLAENLNEANRWKECIEQVL
ncbi:unnamed protein product [Caenorhabditis angaria]|uniref:Uncharacterized protein n=1 Tax=Caenorhabditis angaria TaxID=860376 RepID=A0A9P1IYC1_9PELO|nr:unnamed protein product [Caenorhabditis angaria]